MMGMNSDSNNEKRNSQTGERWLFKLVDVTDREGPGGGEDPSTFLGAAAFFV